MPADGAAPDARRRPDRIDAHLAGDRMLAPLVKRAPGMRVPGAFDPWELAVRAVLGQQVSVRAATTVSGRLVELFGERDDEVWTFPRPEALANATVSDACRIDIPGVRAGRTGLQ